jgi:hypothetical protein
MRNPEHSGWTEKDDGALAAEPIRKGGGNVSPIYNSRYKAIRPPKTLKIMHNNLNVDT